jgi:hypothetical protein
MANELEKLRSKCDEYDTFIDSNKLREQFEKNGGNAEDISIYYQDEDEDEYLERCNKERSDSDDEEEKYEHEFRRMQEEEERWTMLEEYAEDQEFRKMLGYKVNKK